MGHGIVYDVNKCIIIKWPWNSVWRQRRYYNKVSVIASCCLIYSTLRERGRSNKMWVFLISNCSSLMRNFFFFSKLFDHSWLRANGNASFQNYRSHDVYLNHLTRWLALLLFNHLYQWDVPWARYPFLLFCVAWYITYVTVHM